MNMARANEGIWQCDWCKTKNNTSQSSQGERCLVCRQFKGSPVWPEVGEEEQSESIRQSYLSADFISIANAIGSSDISFSNSRYERNALEIALGIELENLKTYYRSINLSGTIRPFIGWVWPEANFVKGLTIYRDSTDRRERCRIDRNSQPDLKAVNLGFESSFNPGGTSLSLALFFGRKNRVESRSRKISYITDGRY